jgi:hypothetical protein
MAKMVPVDQAQRAGKRWRRPQGYAFAAEYARVPVASFELSHVALTMPIAFVKQSERYLPVGVMAPKGTNLFVGPQTQWLGIYVPAALRAHPFQLVAAENGGQPTLCIDEESGLLVDKGADNAEPFVDADDTPSPVINEITKMLRQIEQDRPVTQMAVQGLTEAGLIKPWPMTVPIGNQQITVDDLYCVDEAALNALDDAAFLKLRNTFGLVMAYTQLLSGGQVGNALVQLGILRQRLAQGDPALPRGGLPIAP